jgi:ABC-2 type transport system permease protein
MNETDGGTVETGTEAAAVERTETRSGYDRSTSRVGRFLSDVWVNFVRWNLKAVRNPFVLVVSLVQPVIFLILFTEVFGGIATGVVGGGAAGNDAYVTFLVPAIVIQVALIAAATSGIGLVEDIENGMFEKTLVSPMNRVAVFLGKTLAEVARIAVQILIVLGLGVFLGAEIVTGLAGAVGVVLVGIVFSVWFTAYSNVIAIRTGDSESTIISANLLQFPLLFVSTAFLPREALPGWIRVVADLNPVTYGVEAARTIVTEGWVWEAILGPLQVLLLLDIAFAAVAVYTLAKATSART